VNDRTEFCQFKWLLDECERARVDSGVRQFLPSVGGDYEDRSAWMRDLHPVEETDCA
jgi:hypothetical protein